jgi:hypothetical protein
VLHTGTGKGGRGGLTQTWGKLGGPGHLYVQNGVQALAMVGVRCTPYATVSVKGYGFASTK